MRIEQFRTLLPSTFLDFCWVLVDELVFIRDATQVLPWLSNGVAESYSSLFISYTPAVLKIKESTSLVFAWKLHLQWHRGVFYVTMVVHEHTRHNRQWTIDWWCLLARECTPWCSGISLSWSLLLTCELVFLKMMKADVFWLIRGGLPLLLISLLAWVLERLNAWLPSTLFVARWFVRPLPMSECFIVDLFCGTCLISLCSIAEVVVWFGSHVHTKPWTGTVSHPFLRTKIGCIKDSCAPQETIAHISWQIT
jgi:hypothetical protein